MDKNEAHASINVKKLADSLRGKFETLYPLSRHCCIYRAPQPLRCLNPSAYTPEIVSIGPLHHGKEELKSMEEHKIRYLQYFLQRTKVSIEDFISFIKDKEAKLRRCFEETVELGSDEFVMIILVDAVFLVEFFLRGSKPNFITDDDRIFTKTNVEVWDDLWMLENQIPLFILNDLFNLAKTATYGDYYEGLSLIKITHWFRKDVRFFFPIEENLLERNFSEAEHFLDLLRLCLHQPLQSPAPKKLKPQNIPTLTELHEAGVQFKMSSCKNLFDIKFHKGILEIPFLAIYEGTDRLFINLQAFERLHCQNDSKYVNDYVIIMNYLVNTTKDVELLVQNGVIENWLSNSEAVSKLFHDLVKGTNLNTANYRYAGLIEDLKVYCRFPWHRWKATLKQNYFNSPWASISIVAAVVLLLLTFIQAVCSIIAL